MFGGPLRGDRVLDFATIRNRRTVLDASSPTDKELVGLFPKAEATSKACSLEGASPRTCGSKPLDYKVLALLGEDQVRA